MKPARRARFVVQPGLLTGDTRQPEADPTSSRRRLTPIASSSRCRVHRTTAPSVRGGDAASAMTVERWYRTCCNTPRGVTSRIAAATRGTTDIPYGKNEAHSTRVRYDAIRGREDLLGEIELVLTVHMAASTHPRFRRKRRSRKGDAL